jgi:hypothetical protein
MSMNNYQTIATNDFKFGIREQDTKLFIAVSLFPDDCKKYTSKLNKGSGFNGSTPRFFCDPPLNLVK